MRHSGVVEADYKEHVTTIVPSGHWSARWKCMCGASTSGRWLRSEEEAQKTADRHLVRAQGSRP